MSLCTDIFFADALRANADIVEATRGNIYNTVDDEINPDSTSIPYLMLFNDGSVNDTGTKDEAPESETDIDTIVVGVAARSRKELAHLASLCRLAIKRGYYDIDTTKDGYVINDYTFSAGRVSFDIDKPCYYQELTYRVETDNIEK